MSPREKKETIKIPSDTSYVRKVSNKILEYLITYNLSDTELFNIRLCIEEALRNAIEHGNRSKKSLPVEVSFSLHNGKLEVSVEDRGEGFDYKNLPDPTTDENIMREGGRGVFLIRHLMDKVCFNEKGNKITMIKKLDKSLPTGRRGGLDAHKDRR